MNNITEWVDKTIVDDDGIKDGRSEVMKGYDLYESYII